MDVNVYKFILTELNIMVSCEELKEILESEFQNSQVEVLNPRGDDVHFKISIIYSGFEGMNKIAQHKAVYKALGNDFGKCGTTLHAIELKTKAN